MLFIFYHNETQNLKKTSEGQASSKSSKQHRPPAASISFLEDQRPCLAPRRAQNVGSQVHAGL